MITSTLRIGTSQFQNEQIPIIPHDIRVSWEHNRAGMLTFSITLQELQRQGWSKLLATTSDNVTFDDAYAGYWFGIVTMTTVRDGIVEVTAQTNHIRMKKKLLAFGNLEDWTPGNVLIEAVKIYNNIADNAYPFTMSPGDIDTTSKRISIAANPAMDFYDELLPMLTDEMNMELQLINAIVKYKQRIGTDKSASVVLRSQQDGGEVISYAITSDLFSVTNEMRGIGLERVVSRTAAATGTQRSTTSRRKPQGGTKATAAAAGAGQWVQTNYGVRNRNSVLRWTPQQERRDYPNIRTQARMVARLSTELERISEMFPTLELDIIHTSDAAARLREGDTVSVNLGNGIALKARVMVRTLDVARGVMTLALRAETGITG